LAFQASIDAIRHARRAYDDLAGDRFFWMAFASNGDRTGGLKGSALRFNRLKIIHSRYKVTYRGSYRRAVA
jgi:hypothetical protein